MKHIRQAMAWLVAVAFAATTFAAHAAPEKIFSVSVSPGVVTGGATVTIEATIKNETPNGNSSINSLRLNLPTGFTVANTAGDPPTANWPGQPGWMTGGTTVSLSNMSPLKPNQSFKLTLKAVVGTTAPACTAQTWTAQAWTGSSFSGDTFRQLADADHAGSPTTLVASGLALQFVPLTVSVVAGDPFGVSVKTTSACPVGTVLPEAVVTLTGAPAFTGGGEKTTSGGTASWTPTFGNVGAASLTASAPGFLSASMSLTVYDGSLNCEPTPPFTFDAAPIVPANSPMVNDITKTGYAKGRRGEFNKDGQNCAVVGYTFTNDIPANNTVSLVWDLLTQPGAAFEYTATWKSEYVDATTGLPTLKTRVQWAGLASPVVGKACLAPDLPEPYGTLAGGGMANASVTSLTLTPSAGAPPVPPVPFPIVVGGERMTVTAVGASWTVVRGAGGTTATAHIAGVKVMSTPLPLDASGNEMRMCIVSETWRTVPAGTADCVSPDPTPGSYGPRACVRVTTTVFDVGDGVMIRGGN